MTEDFILQLLKDMDIDKATGIDNLSGKFLKDEASILAKPIFEICDHPLNIHFFQKISRLPN